jgi:pyrroline-5-carboxylate reductase
MDVPSVGFLGYGRMAQAISAGLDRSGTIPYAEQAASDLDADRLNELAKERGFRAMEGNRELREICPIVVVAVKPHQVREALTKSEASPFARRLYISIAAGVSLADLKSWLPAESDVVRALPNLPALTGQGVTLLCASPDTTAYGVERARAIFDSVGVTVPLPESRFNQGTAVSGSGPAYFFLVMEAMIRGAVRLGLDWETSRELVLRTALGSAETALARPELSLAELRDQVTSPGGTTAEALYVLENGAVGARFQEALKAAAKKAGKLT